METVRQEGMGMVDPRTTLWTQFILAAALARVARPVVEQSGEDYVSFSYTDTHAGSGRIDGPLAPLARVMEERSRFSNKAFFSALDAALPPVDHPGSWVLAGRVLSEAGGRGMAVEMDVNDIDPALISLAKERREQAWVRLWSEDWFLFLRSRLRRPERPHFVFVDPPGDDARGPGYAIDAAILLDTLGVPYMISYPVTEAAQDSIDQIGRTGLELRLGGEGGHGVLLGGGGESVLLDVISDLKVLADLLDGGFTVRLPQAMDTDYVI